MACSVACWGKSTCKNCKNNCKTWFPGSTDLRCACLKTCKDHPRPASKENFLTDFANIPGSNSGNSGQADSEFINSVLKIGGFIAAAIVLIVIAVIINKRLKG